MINETFAQLVRYYEQKPLYYELESKSEDNDNVDLCIYDDEGFVESFLYGDSMDALDDVREARKLGAVIYKSEHK